MTNYSKLYWLTRLDGINALLITISIISLLFALAIIIGHFLSKDFDCYYSGDKLKSRIETRRKFTSKIKHLIICGVLTSILCILLPTKSEVIFIMAGGKTIDFIETDTSINKIPSQTTQIISTFLEKQIEDIKKEK